MPQYVVEEVPDLTIPEDTIIRAKLLEIKDKTIEWRDKQTGEPRSAVLLEWWWEPTGDEWVLPDGRKRRVKGECDARLSNHPGNKFRTWAEALLNRELTVEMKLDTEDLVGLQADITVKHRTFKGKTGEDRTIEEVFEVFPLAGSSDDLPF